MYNFRLHFLECRLVTTFLQIFWCKTGQISLYNFINNSFIPGMSTSVICHELHEIWKDVHVPWCSLGGMPLQVQGRWYGLPAFYSRVGYKHYTCPDQGQLTFPADDLIFSWWHMYYFCPGACQSTCITHVLILFRSYVKHQSYSSAWNMKYLCPNPGNATCTAFDLDQGTWPALSQPQSRNATCTAPVPSPGQLS